MDDLAFLPGRYVYLIKTRDFVRLNAPVLKVGRTRDILQRACAYPLGSVLVGCWLVHDDVAAERSLIDALAAAPSVCRCLRNIGNEWFHAHSLACECDMVALCGRVAAEVVREQAVPTGDPRICRGGTGGTVVDDDDDNDNDNDVDADVDDDTTGSGRNDDGAAHDGAVPVVPIPHPRLEDAFDPYAVLTAFWAQCQREAAAAGIRAMSWQKFTQRAIAWARDRGYHGPPLLQNMAEKLVSKSGGRRSLVNEDGAVLRGFLMPFAWPTMSAACASSATPAPASEHTPTCPQQPFIAPPPSALPHSITGPQQQSFPAPPPSALPQGPAGPQQQPFIVPPPHVRVVYSLCLAVMQGKYETVKNILENGVDPNASVDLIIDGVHLRESSSASEGKRKMQRMESVFERKKKLLAHSNRQRVCTFYSLDALQWEHLPEYVRDELNTVSIVYGDEPPTRLSDAARQNIRDSLLRCYRRSGGSDEEVNRVLARAAEKHDVLDR